MIDLGAALKTYIYLVSSSLLYPVLFLLAVLTLFVIVYAGTFFAEWLERSRLKGCPPQRLPERLKGDGYKGAVAHRVVAYIRSLQELADVSGDQPAAVENLLQSTTLDLWKSMDRLRMLVRIAPSLGLIGTLIPMGTGLAALGQGDMARLSSDLVIAFTTTVTGLAIGTLAFFFYTVRRRWVEEDIKNMELATELLAPQPEETRHALHEQTPN
jgi:biopolymer transport protein ExbB/TolQ